MRTKQVHQEMSWWCGLDRQNFQRAIAQRVDGWRKVKPNAADGVGARLRESWIYERRSYETRRSA